MNQWVILIVFICVLFIYIHIQHQYKVSNDLEIYKVIPKTKDDIEDLMELRQPAQFYFDNRNLIDSLSLPSLEDNFGSYEVSHSNGKKNKLTQVIQMMRNTDSKIDITMKNKDFLDETELYETICRGDDILRPPMCNGMDADLLIGKRDITTPLMYHIHYRTILMNTFGDVEVIMIPPKYAKYIQREMDYDTLSYVSEHNIWEMNNETKIKAVRTALQVGEILYIPAYWFYSVRFTTTGSICRLSYFTYVGCIANWYSLLIQKFRYMRLKINKMRGIEEKNDREDDVIYPELEIGKDEGNKLGEEVAVRTAILIPENPPFSPQLIPTIHNIQSIPNSKQVDVPNIQFNIETKLNKEESNESPIKIESSTQDDGITISIMPVNDISNKDIK